MMNRMSESCCWMVVGIVFILMAVTFMMGCATGDNGKAWTVFCIACSPAPYEVEGEKPISDIDLDTAP